MRDVSLRRQTVQVHAPRELVFEVVASAGKKLYESQGRKVVEFETKWRDRVMKTVEELELEPPQRIGYRWVEGPLEDVEEEIVFESTGARSTLMTYSGRLGPGSGLLGWLRTLLFVRPIFNRLVEEHLLEGKRVAEKRAERSRLYARETDGGPS